MTVLSRAAVALTLLVGLTVVRLPAETSGASKPIPAAPRARIERPVPFHAGEQLTYDVSWSSFLTAGTATATVKEKRGGSAPVYYIVAEGRPAPLVGSLYPLYYKLDTLLDAFTLLPQRGSVYTEEGSRHRYRVTEFDRPAHRASYSMQTTTTVHSTLAVPGDVQDALSAIYVLRAVALKAGDRMTIPVSDGGSMYRVRIDVQAPEQVQTPGGEMRAWKMVPSVTDANNQPVGHHMAMWLSDDARRLPVRFQAELPVGTFDLVLRDAR